MVPQSSLSHRRLFVTLVKSERSLTEHIGYVHTTYRISTPPQDGSPEPYGLSEPFQILLKSHTNAYVRENFDGP